MRRAGVLLTNPNLLRLRFLGLGQRHGQDSILIARADFVRIHSDWERDAPTEFADVTLCAFGFLAVRSLAASLAADRQVPSCKEISMSSLRIPGSSTTATTLSLFW